MASQPISSFSGIGSGVDYKTLVDQIIAAESAPATATQARIDKANAQLDAYKSYRTLLDTLETSAKSLRDGSAFDAVSTTVSGASGNGRNILSANASAGAQPGSYAVQVLATAQNEKLSSAVYNDSTTPLGLSGDFVINKKIVSIASTDSLTTVRDKINATNSGTTASGVSAAIVSDSTSAKRLVLTSTVSGAAGIDIMDGNTGVATQLGWLDGTVSLKNGTSAGAASDQFASSTATIASQLGLSTNPGPQVVTVGGQSVTIDLGVDSLSSIATKLSALTGIQASVQSTTTNGVTKYYLDIRNTTNFVDAGHTLEQLGVLKGGRSAIAQQVQGAALTAGDATTPATGATLLTALWNGGSASGAQGGDTLAISGTRGDGTAVNINFAITGSTTVQDLLNALNDPTTGFGAGTRPATASIDAQGRITVTDNTAGSSALSLNIVANNQGGGRLDLGTFGVTKTGLARTLVAGADAKFTIDGVLFTRSSNTVTDAIADTTLTLTAADPTLTATVSIDRSAQSVQSTVQSYIDAYNKLADFIATQQKPGADSSSNPVLYNDPLLRLARSSLASNMLASVSGAATGLTTAGMAGISVTRDGKLTLDATKFTTAFNTRFTDVQTLFMERGTSTNALMDYSSSTAATQSGTYAVNITQAASQGSTTGVGFSGTYTDDATPDTVRIADLATGGAALVTITNGMTGQQIVDAMNSAFATPQAQSVTTSNALYADAAATTPATSSTLLTALYSAGGVASGTIAGDSIDFGGVSALGVPFSGTFVVGPGSTVGDLVAQIQSSLGSGATVSVVNGKITATSSTPGASTLSLTVTAKNEGGGSLNFGAPTVSNTGRNAMTVAASLVGGQIKLLQSAFGAAAGFALSFIGGGTDSTAQLGLTAGNYSGTDVVGTIGGFAATGVGQQLVGNTGTAVEGLSLAYRGTTTGAAGSVTLTQGVGAMIDRLITSWTTDNTGTIALKETSLNATVASQQKRLDDFNARMDRRKTALLKQYLAMDVAVQKFTAQLSAFQSVLPKTNS